MKEEFNSYSPICSKSCETITIYIKVDVPRTEYTTQLNLCSYIILSQQISQLLSYQVVIDSHLNLLSILLYYLSFTTLHLVGMKNVVNKILTFDLLIIHIHDFFNFYSMFLFLWRANLLFQVVHWFKRLCIRLVPLFLFFFFFFF